MTATQKFQPADIDPGRLADSLRFLAADAVEAAKSGHPGMPMGMAEIAEVLWRRHLRHNPGNPAWPDRDRFVLSNGHGSMLLYGLLHLTGYDLSIEDIKQFRQLHSRTPGHPEVGLTPGVETTTGPLAQGLANAVGMALAERMLAARFNRPGHTIVDHRTYAFVGDGCMMEGLSHEAASLAGVFGLPKLTVIYDDNEISIDGEVKGWFRDDTAKRFEAYGWNVIPHIDGHNADAVDGALHVARASDRPTLIVCRTVIGKGAPTKAGAHEAHGAPLGADEVAGARAALGWHHPPFEIPPELRAAWDARPRGAALESEWQGRFEAYRAAHPDLAAEFERAQSGSLPSDWNVIVSNVYREARTSKARATRKASQEVLDALTSTMPELFGGSADLTWSTLTFGNGSQELSADGQGNYVHWGVREFGMAATMNGLALHRGFIPYSGTFLMFSDYARSGIRMSALMHQRVIYVFTHDSIGLGEDGPTHQPIEHAASLRLIPNLDVWRPCDPLEVAVAWIAAVERTDGPTCLLLSRQNLPPPACLADSIDSIRRGGYVLSPPEGSNPRALLIATGSEVCIALDAQSLLRQRGIDVGVVSMVSTTVFDRQPASWRDSVLPPRVPCVSIEAGVTNLWREYIGREGLALGLDRFGDSAPANVLYDYYGLTGPKVAERIVEWLGK